MGLLLALIALIVVAVLGWKAFGPKRPGPGRVIGPDDDPDFIWRIGRQSRTDGPAGPVDPSD